MTFNYIEHFLNLFFVVPVYIFISAFASLFDISKGNLSSPTGLNVFAVGARIKKYKLGTKKWKKEAP